jgi:hypothetical protein
VTRAFTDYEVEAEPSLQALRAGDPGAFLDLLPASGGSLVVRSPFALLPGIWGGGDLALFRSMAARAWPRGRCSGCCCSTAPRPAARAAARRWARWPSVRPTR